MYLDTHVVCWLYEGRVDLLSAPAAEAIEAGRLMVSPVVDLELQYLHEVGRISKGPRPVLSALAADIGLGVSNEALSRIVVQARELSWTRDPFDRLIVAEAMLTGAKLVTRDDVIRRHFRSAVW